MGPSGSGKVDLLAVLGLLDKANGAIPASGEDISNMDDNQFAILRNRFFGFVFQTFNRSAKS